MPYVDIKVAGSLNPEQKKEIAQGVTKLLHEVANKAPESTYITIQEVPRDAWAVGGSFLG